MKTDEENLYIGELLTTSDIKSEYFAGQKVAVAYCEHNNKKVLIVDGIVKIED